MTHLITTPATLGTCPRCWLPTLTGIDEGIPVRVDLIPLPNLAAEINALAAGRWTYARLRDGSLAHRDTDRLADPQLSAPVHVQHTCPHPLPRRTP